MKIGQRGGRKEDRKLLWLLSKICGGGGGSVRTMPVSGGATKGNYGKSISVANGAGKCCGDQQKEQ